jgi:hypothetical protein
MTTSRSDDWTVESWRTEPRLSGLQSLEVDDYAPAATPLWKDVTVAAILAILLWVAAAALFW